MKLSVSGLQKKPGLTESFKFVLENIEEDSDAKLTSPVAVEARITNTGLFLELTAMCVRQYLLPAVNASPRLLSRLN